MRKYDQYHRVSVIVRIDQNLFGALRQRGPFKNFAQVSFTNDPQVEAQLCSRHESGEANGTAQSASTSGYLQATRKRQSCRKHPAFVENALRRVKASRSTMLWDTSMYVVENTQVYGRI